MSIEWAQSLLYSIAHVPVGRAALLFMGFGALQIFIPVFPGDLLLLFGASLWAGSGNERLLLAAYWLGITSASLAAYELGRRFGMRLFAWRWVRRFFSERAQQAVTQWLNGRGAATLFCAKFVTGVNIPMLLISGAMGVGRRKAYPPIMAATAVQNALLFGLGSLMGENWNAIAELSGKYQSAFTACIAGIILAAVFLPRLLKKRLHKGGP